MSFLDKIAAAIRPQPTDEDRIRARNAALALAGQDDWLAQVIEQHQQVEALFASALAAPPGAERAAALKRLGQQLSAHSMAEEVVLYPAIAAGHKADAGMAYEEEAMTKIQMVALERLDPNSETWREKLEAIRDAVAHHVHDEESDWYPRLHHESNPADLSMLTVRFREEYHRHGDVGHSHGSPAHFPPG